MVRDLFDRTPPVHRFEFRVPPESARSLRENPRKGVEAQVSVDGRPALGVRLRLKGATGSFRPYDDRPSLTVEADGSPDPTFPGGLTKLHLNNSVEDPSRLRELLGHRIFTRAGIPCPRVSHARVLLDGRDLGLQVLVEGCTAEWIRRSFGGTEGSVFEPVNGATDSVRLREVAGWPGTSGPALPAEFLDAHGGPQKTRWTRAATVLDRESLADFVALELLTGHPDGYGLARNNYRIWVPRDGRGLRWIPHGLDRLFTAPEIPWPPSFAGPMAQAMAASDGALDRLADRLRPESRLLEDAAALQAEVEGGRDALRPHLDSREWREVREGAEELLGQIRRRHEVLRGQLSSMRVQAVDPIHGLHLEGWVADADNDAVTLARNVSADGSTHLRLTARGAVVAGWTWNGTLPPGNYRLEARGRMEGFRPVGFGGEGGLFLQSDSAGSRIWDRPGPDGDSLPTLRFRVGKEPRRVRIRIGFRAGGGMAEFDEGSLKVRRDP